MLSIAGKSSVLQSPRWRQRGIDPSIWFCYRVGVSIFERTRRIVWCLEAVSTRDGSSRILFTSVSKKLTAVRMDLTVNTQVKINPQVGNAVNVIFKVFFWTPSVCTSPQLIYLVPFDVNTRPQDTGLLKCVVWMWFVQVSDCTVTGISALLHSRVRAGASFCTWFERALLQKAFVQPPSIKFFRKRAMFFLWD